MSATKGAAIRRIPAEAVERFWAFVDKSGECWLWTGGRVNHYGTFTFDGRSRAAHRVAYVIQNGPLTNGLVVRHTCGNSLCVRGNHLKIGTQGDNVRDSIEAGSFMLRMPTGERHPLSRFTDQHAVEIVRRLDAGESQQQIADEIGVRQSTISKLARKTRARLVEENA